MRNALVYGTGSLFNRWQWWIGLDKPDRAMRMIDEPRAQMDTAQFDRLLVMAGPVLAAKLIVQLRSDLSTVKQKLHVATNPVDWAQIQAQSHTIMGLAATMGAEKLLQLAKGLSDIAHDPAPDLLTSGVLVTDLMQALDAALVFLAQHASGKRAPG